jgi:hypothetical protein
MPSGNYLIGLTSVAGAALAEQEEQKQSICSSTVSQLKYGSK